MKVKIFSRSFTSQPLHNSPAELEEEVNEWMKKTNAKIILDQKISSTSGVNEDGKVFVNVTVSIFYQE